MKHIFLPVDNFNDFKCYEVLDSNTVRSYRSTPVIGSEVDYIDFFVNSHYLEKQGKTTLEYSPICLDSTSLTNEVYYRNDFPQIMLCFVLILFFITYFARTILRNFFRRLYL